MNSRGGLGFLWFVLGIVIGVMLGAFAIIQANNPSEDFGSLEKYCKETFGEEYFYNLQQGEPFEVRSCDRVSDDGIWYMNYFSYSDYKEWKEEREWRYLGE